MRTLLFGSIAPLVVAASAGLLGGCALVAGYDFGRYSEGAGGGASSSSSTSVSTSNGGGTSTAASTGTDGATSGSSGTGGAPTTAVLFMSPEPTVTLAVDTTGVYLTTGTPGQLDGKVWRVEKDGSSAVALVSNQPYPDGLALDPQLKFAYWVSTTGGKGTIRRVPTDGGMSELIFMPLERVGGLAFSSGTIYWTTPESGFVFERTASDSIDFVVQMQSFPGAITADNSNLYWLDSGNDGSSNGLVMKSDLAGKGATAIANGQNSPGQIAINTERVYWSTADGGVYDILKNGTGATFTYVDPKAAAEPCSSLAADEKNVYFAQGSTVYRALIGSSLATAYVVGLKAPLKIALDPTSLYVAGGDGSGKGLVLKASK